MRACSNCGKSHIMAGKRNLLRGHYNPTKKKQKKANLVKTKLLTKTGSVLICTKCLKKITKAKKIPA